MAPAPTSPHRGSTAPPVPQVHRTAGARDVAARAEGTTHACTRTGCSGRTVTSPRSRARAARRGKPPSDRWDLHAAAGPGPIVRSDPFRARLAVRSRALRLAGREPGRGHRIHRAFPAPSGECRRGGLWERNRGRVAQPSVATRRIPEPVRGRQHVPGCPLSARGGSPPAKPWRRRGGPRSTVPRGASTARPTLWRRLPPRHRVSPQPPLPAAAFVSLSC